MRRCVCPWVHVYLPIYLCIGDGYRGCSRRGTYIDGSLRNTLVTLVRPVKPGASRERCSDGYLGIYRICMCIVEERVLRAADRAMQGTSFARQPRGGPAEGVVNHYRER